MDCHWVNWEPNDTKETPLKKSPCRNVNASWSRQRGDPPISGEHCPVQTPGNNAPHVNTAFKILRRIGFAVSLSIEGFPSKSVAKLSRPLSSSSLRSRWMRCRMVMPRNPVRPILRLGRYLLVEKDVTHLANPTNISQGLLFLQSWIMWFTSVTWFIACHQERRGMVGGPVCRDIRRRRSRILGPLIVPSPEASVTFLVNALELVHTASTISVDDIIHCGFLATVHVLSLTA